MSTSRCELYVSVTNKWTEIGSIKIARKLGAAISFGDCVQVLDGYGCANVSELFDPFEDRWKDLAVPMLTSRCNHKAVAIDNRSFVVAIRRSMLEFLYSKSRATV